MASVIWIGYTTLYRDGGAQFVRVAKTLAKQAAAKFPNADVRCVAVETKREFKASLGAIAAGQLAQLHFVGHSGMYGIMFGTVAFGLQGVFESVFGITEFRSLATFDIYPLPVAIVLILAGPLFPVALLSLGAMHWWTGLTPRWSAVLLVFAAAAIPARWNGPREAIVCDLT